MNWSAQSLMIRVSRSRGSKICLAIILFGGLILLLMTHLPENINPLESRLFPVRNIGNILDEKQPGFFALITSPNHPNCLAFRQRFPMVTQPDGDMNVAFTMVVHKDVYQIARLMRMIYRVNNYYCVHLDSRSPHSFQRAMEGIATCFGPNVELVPVEKRVAVYWGDESVLRPQLICAEQALQNDNNWDYLVNIAGQEFPLKTNLELVAALKALNGSNLIEAAPIKRFQSWVGNRIPPLNASWYKGTIYGAFRRDFLHEAVRGTAVAPIRDAVLEHKALKHPDELFFSTLAYNPHLKLPGACLIAPPPKSEVDLAFLAKYVVWGDYKIACPTKYTRFVCILGTPHISQLRSVPHLFANKFHSDYHPEAYDRMEEWYFEKLSREIASGTYARDSFDTSIYANRSCSHQHL
ncbi:glycosyltransferase 14 family member [Echinococcus multilocularis]|uniref:Glycosyltransferase 14 family member n=1 Tax=Echinococcus multilocularis TaxID=6211 RepID=A0A068XX47_ECHMU|nr:glycosyltransferase 14 family member [Echinococcus multilocularis]